jgi:S1-C subfamily serine protease
MMVTTIIPHRRWATRVTGRLNEGYATFSQPLVHPIEQFASCKIRAGDDSIASLLVSSSVNDGLGRFARLVPKGQKRCRVVGATNHHGTAPRVIAFGEPQAELVSATSSHDVLQHGQYDPTPLLRHAMAGCDRNFGQTLRTGQLVAPAIIRLTGGLTSGLTVAIGVRLFKFLHAVPGCVARMPDYYFKLVRSFIDSGCKFDGVQCDGSATIPQKEFEAMKRSRLLRHWVLTALSLMPVLFGLASSADGQNPSEPLGRPVVPLSPPVVLGLEAEERGVSAPFEVTVLSIRPASPAEVAGLKVGDLLTSVDGQPVGSIEDIANVVQKKIAGDSLRVGFRRGDSKLETIARFPKTNVQLGPPRENPANPPASFPGNPPANSPGSARPAPQPSSSFDGFSAAAPQASPAPDGIDRPQPGSGRLGVTVENFDTAPAGPGVPVKRGAVVVGVAPESPAATAELKIGNVIVAIDGVVIRDAEELIEEISKTLPGQRVEIGVYRGESLSKLSIVLADASGIAPMDPAKAPVPLPNTVTGEQPGKPGEKRNGLLSGLGGAFSGMFGGSMQPNDPPVLRELPPTSLPGQAPAQSGNAAGSSSTEIEQLKTEIESLRRQLESLQRRLGELEGP